MPKTDAPPTPTCPTCGDPAKTEGTSFYNGTFTNHCTDTRGHIWIVRWMAGA